MAFFVIAGKANCLNFTHAVHAAEHLNKHLPSFKYRTIPKLDADWPPWLDRTNSENKWFHTSSPLIWKEISIRGGKPYLIGGLGEFWEYCYDYYGFQSRLSKQELSEIIADNLLIVSSNQGDDKELVIGIMGALNPIIGLLIQELQYCFPSRRNTTTSLKLYDTGLHDADKADFLLEVIDEITPTIKWRPGAISAVTTLGELIGNTDLLLVIENFSRMPHETPDDWFSRCYQAMLLLSEEINTYAKRNLRVVLNHDGPVCFNASVLVEHCTKIRLANIVAVTAHLGMVMIDMAAKRITDLVENFGCPPVWGFTGTLSYIDIGGTIVKGDVYRPFKRNLMRTGKSCLPKGTVQAELRTLSNLLQVDDSLYQEVEQKRKDMQPKSLFAKVRAVASLLKLWYADEITDDVICLGVCSNGSFRFPAGAVFSQAVVQNDKRLWEPFSNYPISLKACHKIDQILFQLSDLFKIYGLGSRLQ